MAEAQTAQTHEELSERPNPHVFAREGNLLIRSGDGVAAEEAFRKAIALESDVPGFHKGLASALGLQGRFVEARAIIERLVAEAHPDPHIISHFGVIQRREGELEAAEKSFRRAISLVPDWPGFQKELAVCLGAQGRLDEARAIMASLLEKDSSDPQLIAYFASLQQPSNDLGAAEGLVREATGLAPDEPGVGNAPAAVEERIKEADTVRVTTEPEPMAQDSRPKSLARARRKGKRR